MSIEKEKTIDHRMMYEGKLLHVYYDKVDIAGETYRREIVEHPGAAAIIPVTEDREILFVKQYTPFLPPVHEPHRHRDLHHGQACLQEFQAMPA